jgi:hypothetical protein
MRKSTAAVMAAALVVATLASTGCSSWFESPAKPANDAIAVANTHLQKAAALESEVASAGAALQKLPYTKAGATDAGKITAGVAGVLAKERTELLAAKSAMDGIAKLEVADPFKEYAKLESAAIDARVALVDSNTLLYGAMDRLYSGLAKASSSVNVQETIRAIGQMQQGVTALADTAAQAAKSAADFFTSKRLGG